jgi:hypothetical protein
MATHSGIRAHMLVREAISEKNLDLEASSMRVHRLVDRCNGQVRRQTISTLRKHIENALRFHKRIYRRHMVPHKILRFMNLPYSSCYITVMYLLTKSMYLANVVGRSGGSACPDAHTVQDNSVYSTGSCCRRKPPSTRLSTATRPYYHS